MANETQPRRNNMFRQLKQVYDFTRTDDPQVTWWVAGAFAIPFVVIIAIGFFLKINWFTWIPTVILAFMSGLLAATLILTRRSEVVGYRRIEGQPGAAGAVLNSLNKKVYNFSEQPVWIDPRTKDMIWRGTSLYGVYLISEGPASRVKQALEKEESKIRRVTQGSEIRIITIMVGRDEGQTPLPELSKAMRKRYKGSMTSAEYDKLNSRLRTIEKKNALGVPAGMDPRAGGRVSRRAMRGR